jgi:hypothetical protein
MEFAQAIPRQPLNFAARVAFSIIHSFIHSFSFPPVGTRTQCRGLRAAAARFVLRLQW